MVVNGDVSWTINHLEASQLQFSTCLSDCRWLLSCNFPCAAYPICCTRTGISFPRYFTCWKNPISERIILMIFWILFNYASNQPFTFHPGIGAILWVVRPLKVSGGSLHRPSPAWRIYQPGQKCSEILVLNKNEKWSGWWSLVITALWITTLTLNLEETNQCFGHWLKPLAR